MGLVPLQPCIMDIGSISDPDHEIMAKKFIRILAEAIREADGNRFDVDYYMYLAWQGAMNAGYQLGILDDKYGSQFYEKHEILEASGNSFCN